MTLISAGIINATADTTTVDSFEDSDYDEYSVTSGSSSNFETIDESSVSFSAIDGSKIHHFIAGFGGTTQRLISTSGLPNYPTKGDRFECYLRSTGSNEASFLFGVTDDSNYYRFTVGWNADQVTLFNNDDGDETSIGFSGVTLPTDTWIRCEVTWDDGTLGGSDNDITVAVIDNSDDSTIATVGPVNDATHAAATGVGFDGNFHGGGQDSWIDNYQLL